MIDLLRRFLTPSENSLICMRDQQTGKPRHAHWFPWLMLVWTFWIFATPVLFTGTEFQNWMWPTFTSFALFLAMFHRVYYRDRSQVVWNAIGIAVLGFLVTPFNPGAQGYLIYACAFLAFHGTSREAARNMVIVLVLYSIEWQWLGFGWITLRERDPRRFRRRIHEHQLRAQARARRGTQAEPRRNPPPRRPRRTRTHRTRFARSARPHVVADHVEIRTRESAFRSRSRRRTPRNRGSRNTSRAMRSAQVRRAVTGIRAAGLAAELASARLLLESNGVRLDVRTRRHSIAGGCRDRIGDDGARSRDQRPASCARDRRERLAVRGKPRTCVWKSTTTDAAAHRARQRTHRHARTARAPSMPTCAWNRSAARARQLRVTMRMPDIKEAVAAAPSLRHA